MGAKKNTITINGRTYDAATGQAVNDASKSVVVQPSEKQQPEVAHKIAVKQVRATSKVKARHPHTVTAHQPQRATTLMRSSVKRPQQKSRPAAVAGLVSQPEHIVVHHGRTKAKSSPKTYTKSPQISKFAPAHSVSKRTQTIPVAQAPSTHHHASHSYDISNTPPAPAVPQPTVPLKEIHQNLFETAINDATSHKAKPYHSKHNPKNILRIGASALTVFLLLAFFTYQNLPNLALKQATGVIGFHAKIPSYKPAGFSLNDSVKYEPGKVTLNFQSNSDTRNFTLTQASSGIGDSELTSEFLAGQSYQTIQTKGVTAYVYGGSNVTWAHNGIWYDLEGNAQLSQSQLTSIVSSML